MSLFGGKKQRSSDDCGIVPFIPSEYLEHTAEHPFCGDMSCPCHENQDAIQETYGYVQDGLLSTDDANRRYRGRTV